MKSKIPTLAQQDKLRQDKLRARFDEVHTEGAKRFGLRWLMANQCAVNAAGALGIDASDLKTKTLLSETCFRILALCEKKEGA